MALRDAKIHELESQLMNGHAVNNHAEQQPVAVGPDLELVQKQLSSLQVTLSGKDLELEEATKSYGALKESYDGLKDEQEDLLIMLTDQEEKVKKYKKVCKELGHQVESSSSDDEEDS